MRKTEYQTFRARFDEILRSDGKLCLPNVEEITNPGDALMCIASTSHTLNVTVEMTYYFLIRHLQKPTKYGLTKEVCWRPKIFLNARGMGGQFDGSGVILAHSGGSVPTRAYTFHMCKHEWDESGANHSRGWHPAICTKCGFDASIDSGD